MTTDWERTETERQADTEGDAVRNRAFRSGLGPGIVCSPK